jgi:hypothetical protein
MFGTKNNLPKGLAEKIELKKKKKKKKNLSLCVENVEDQSPLGYYYCKYTIQGVLWISIPQLFANLKD